MPSGHVELDETPIEALYRETEEETGLTKEEGGAEQLEWFTLEEVGKLSPMPKNMHSRAEYALKLAGAQ